MTLAGAMLAGCAKNDDFSIPNLECEQPNIVANLELSNVYANLSTEMTKYEKDDIISGYVVSSDVGGNFYREIYFVDKDNKFAGLFKADIRGSFARYEVGSQIYIKLKDTYIQKNNDILTIGYPEKPGDRYVGYLGDPTYKKHIVKGCTRWTTEELAKVTTVVSLKEATTDETLIGKLITLRDVQFSNKVIGNYFFDPSNIENKATKNFIVSKESGVISNVFFRVVEQSSAFAKEIVPNKSGTMTGIMTKFGNDYQFVPRTMEDLKGLDQDPFQPGSETGPEEPGADIVVEPGKYLAFPGADFEDWAAFLKSLNSFGPDKVLVSEAKGQGWNNSTGLKIAGKPQGTGYAFTVSDTKVVEKATKISFLMKGKAANRSLSINLYNTAGEYVAYNLENVTKSKIVKRTKTNKEEQYINQYEGVINTEEWVKIVLEIDGFAYNTSGKGDVIGFKFGGNTKTIVSEYDLVIDEIRFEDGTPVEGGEETPGGETPGTESPVIKVLGKEGTMSDLVTVNNQGITVATGEGKDKGVAFSISGTSTNNGAGFSIGDVKVPANAKNITFYVKGKSVPGGKANDRGTFVVNTHDAAKGILANYSIANGLAAGKSGELVVAGANDNRNDYVGSIETNGWVKVVLPLEGIDINDSGQGGFLQFRFAKDGDFTLLIDQISFE